MAWTGLHITDFGLSVQAKTPAGGTIHLTRVVLGDGALGSSSMISRKAVFSERLSLPIDAVRRQDNVANVISRVTNDNVDEGFYWREMSIYCLDPETNEEGAYTYDNCRDDASYFEDKNSKVKIQFYLRMRLKFEASTQIEFPASGELLYVLYDEFVAEQERCDAALNAHISDANPHMQSRLPITQRPRDPALPSYGLADDTVTLRAAPFTGAAPSDLLDEEMFVRVVQEGGKDYGDH